VIRAALTRARVDPLQVGFLESHGTGTRLGDPIEAAAFAEVLCNGRSEENPLIVGSVKSNFGHLEAAAGIAGLMKAVLALKHREIPPNLHFHQPTPVIAWNEMPVRIPVKLTAWNGDGQRIAGVSSFGFSGTNAHVVLGSAPEEAQAPRQSRVQGLGFWSRRQKQRTLCRSWEGVMRNTSKQIRLCS